MDKIKFVDKLFVDELFVRELFGREQFGDEDGCLVLIVRVERMVYVLRKGGCEMICRTCPPKGPEEENKQGVVHIGKIIHELDNLLYRNLLAQGKRCNYDQITVMNGWILRYLSKNEGKEIFQKDIENEFGITKSTVAGIIKLMEQKGFITRVSVPRDARLKQLVLTDMGREYEEKMGSQMRRNNMQLQKNITDEELETFLRVIDKIKQNVKE